MTATLIVETLIVETLRAGARVLVAGAPGTGKSTLAADAAAAAARVGIGVGCIGCDPGSPAFGPPGAACTGEWDGGGWKLVDVEPLCTLDAARFRLPLVQAVLRLLDRSERRPWLVDAPGTVRSTGGAELVTALAVATLADLVVLIERDAGSGDLAAALRAQGLRVVTAPAAATARSRSRLARARHRTALWDAHLAAGGREVSVDIDSLALLGLRPVRNDSSVWRGRQIALLRGRNCAAFGEVVALDGSIARIRVRGDANNATGLLIRDARRAPNGLLATAEHAELARHAAHVELAKHTEHVMLAKRGERAEHAEHGELALPAEPDSAPRDELDSPGPIVRAGPFTATLVNGVFRDPLLLVRMAHRSRTLLFDLGETNRLGARVAHQVTDVFISHAHIDHIAGFLWLLRARIGETTLGRLYGPPGIAANVSGLVNGVHWDRAGEGAPRFDVTELDADGALTRFSVRAGEPTAVPAGRSSSRGGLLLDEPLLRVRAVTLDHLTPVLAFALESAVDVNVRKERLAALGLEPGPWLACLKDGIAAGRLDDVLDLPDGSRRRVRELADELVLLRPGAKLVYATDLADTVENRQRLAALARDADVMFCESTFRVADADRAARTGHLTTRACGEIAAAANVARLVPFHFSRRYETSPGEVYREVLAACASTVVPTADDRR